MIRVIFSNLFLSTFCSFSTRNDNFHSVSTPSCMTYRTVFILSQMRFIRFVGLMEKFNLVFIIMGSGRWGRTNNLFVRLLIVIMGFSLTIIERTRRNLYQSAQCLKTNPSNPSESTQSQMQWLLSSMALHYNLILAYKTKFYQSIYAPINHYV